MQNRFHRKSPGNIILKRRFRKFSKPVSSSSSPTRGVKQSVTVIRWWRCSDRFADVGSARSVFICIPPIYLRLLVSSLLRLFTQVSDDRYNVFSTSITGLSPGSPTTSVRLIRNVLLPLLARVFYYVSCTCFSGSKFDLSIFSFGRLTERGLSLVNSCLIGLVTYTVMLSRRL